jgi:hypothetical protein
MVTLCAGVASASTSSHPHQALLALPRGSHSGIDGSAAALAPPAWDPRRFPSDRPGPSTSAPYIAYLSSDGAGPAAPRPPVSVACSQAIPGKASSSMDLGGATIAPAAAATNVAAPTATSGPHATRSLVVTSAPVSTYMDRPFLAPSGPAPAQVQAPPPAPNQLRMQYWDHHLPNPEQLNPHPRQQQHQQQQRQHHHHHQQRVQWYPSNSDQGGPSGVSTQPWTPRVSLVVPPHMLPSGGAVGSAVPPQAAMLQGLTPAAADVISQLWEEIGAVKRRRKGVALGARTLEQLLPPRECPVGCVL